MEKHLHIDLFLEELDFVWKIASSLQQNDNTLHLFSLRTFFLPHTHFSRFLHISFFLLSGLELKHYYNFFFSLLIEPWVINCPFTIDLSPLTMHLPFMHMHILSVNGIQISNQAFHAFFVPSPGNRSPLKFHGTFGT